MRIGIIGTGAIANKRAQAYRHLGFRVTVCTNPTVGRGERFAKANGAEFVRTAEEMCRPVDVE